MNNEERVKYIYYMKIDGVDIVKNYKEDKLQLFFREKPSNDVVCIIHSNGFLQDSGGAYQQKLTQDAIGKMEIMFMIDDILKVWADDTKDIRTSLVKFNQQMVSCEQIMADSLALAANSFQTKEGKRIIKRLRGE